MGDFLSVDPTEAPYCNAEFVLVDPSCTGSGMTHRFEVNPDDATNPDRLRKLRSIQAMLLKHATKFPNAKRIVYSTCSLHAEENEEVVGEALRFSQGRFQLVKALPEFSESRGLPKYEYGDLCVRMSPETTLTRGFFLAAFERMEEEVRLDGRRKRRRKEEPE